MPLPIETFGKDDKHVRIKNTSPHCYVFSIECENFIPNETITFESHSAYEKLTANLNVDENGSCFIDVHPAVIGLYEGSAEAVIKTSSETLALKYPWGSAMRSESEKKCHKIPLFLFCHPKHKEYALDHLETDIAPYL